MSAAPGRHVRYWVLNAVCGLIVLILLGVHMTVMHLDDLLALAFGTNDAPLDWPQVSERGGSGWLTASYVVLLATALFHGFFGLHTVLTEFFPGARAARRIRLLCQAAGVVLFLVGAAATVYFHFAAVTGAVT